MPENAPVRACSGIEARLAHGENESCRDAQESVNLKKDGKANGLESMFSGYGAPDTRAEEQRGGAYWAGVGFREAKIAVGLGRVDGASLGLRGGQLWERAYTQPARRGDCPRRKNE